MDQFVLIPGPKGDRFVELSRSRMGRVFRKQILRYEDLLYPAAQGGKVHVDEAFADTLIANFTNGVADIVQVPKVNDANEHTEDPDRNIGEVIGLVKTANGVDAIIDVRTDDADKVGKTLLGASGMLHLDYTDTRTGKRMGPTLIHVAVTNRPYIVNLDGFEELLAASNVGDDIENQVLVLSTADNEEIPMTLEEMLAELKANHNIDVSELQTKAAQADAAVALSNTIQEQLVSTGLLTLSNSDQTVTADVLVGAVAEAGTKIMELSGKIDGLVTDAAKTAATVEVEKLIRTGYIYPVNKEDQIELKLSNPDLFKRLLPTQPLVKLSVENGEEPVDEQQETTVTAEIDRLAKVVTDNGYVRK